MAGETELFVAKSVGISIDVFRDARRRGPLADLKPRGPASNSNRGYRSPVVTPEEIRERCLEVQATWSEETRAARAGGFVESSLQLFDTSDLVIGDDVYE